MNISVIVPVYNAEKTIEKTIRALVAQTYSEFEVLMVDNGSTDRSSQICLEYQKKDKRFRYIYVEQKGVSNARNMGLSCAKGNATVKSENRSLIESFKDVKNIVSNECVVHVFSKIYTQDKRHRIVFKMIQLKMSVLLTLYYSIRRG